MRRAALPTHLRTRFHDLSSAKVDVKRTAVFSETKQGNGVYEINGRVFTPQMVDYTPRLGTVEEWTVLNTSQEIHPFHIHVNDFQVMSVNGGVRARTRCRTRCPCPSARRPGKVVIRMRITDVHREVRVPLPHPRPRGPGDDGRRQRVLSRRVWRPYGTGMTGLPSL